MAGMGTRRVRIAKLPPEIFEGTIRATPTQYGEMKTIQEETWSRAYGYAVANGIRIVMIALKKHIPSHVTITGNRVLIYEGQPMTCYGCGETEQMYQVYPKQRTRASVKHDEPPTTWADITARSKQQRKARKELWTRSHARTRDITPEGTW